MTIVIFLQIIMRIISPIVSLPMAWTEEVGRYLFIYAVYVGAAYATKKHVHQKVDVLPLLVGNKGKLIFNIISEIGVIIFAGAMSYFGWQVVQKIAFELVQRAPATRINMGVAYVGPALGMTLCTFRAFQNVYKHIRDFKIGSSDENNFVEGV